MRFGGSLSLSLSLSLLILPIQPAAAEFREQVTSIITVEDGIIDIIQQPGDLVIPVCDEDIVNLQVEWSLEETRSFLPGQFRRALFGLRVAPVDTGLWTNSEHTEVLQTPDSRSSADSGLMPQYTLPVSPAGTMYEAIPYGKFYENAFGAPSLEVEGNTALIIFVDCDPSEDDCAQAFLADVLEAGPVDDVFAAKQAFLDCQGPGDPPEDDCLMAFVAAIPGALDPNSLVAAQGDYAACQGLDPCSATREIWQCDPPCKEQIENADLVACILENLGDSCAKSYAETVAEIGEGNATGTDPVPPLLEFLACEESCVSTYVLAVETAGQDFEGQVQSLSNFLDCQGITPGGAIDPLVCLTIQALIQAGVDILMFTDGTIPASYTAVAGDPSVYVFSMDQYRACVREVSEPESPVSLDWMSTPGYSPEKMLAGTATVMDAIPQVPGPGYWPLAGGTAHTTKIKIWGIAKNGGSNQPKAYCHDKDMETAIGNIIANVPVTLTVQHYCGFFDIGSGSSEDSREILDKTDAYMQAHGLFTDGVYAMTWVYSADHNGNSLVTDDGGRTAMGAESSYWNWNPDHLVAQHELSHLFGAYDRGFWCSQGYGIMNYCHAAIHKMVEYDWQNKQIITDYFS